LGGGERAVHVFVDETKAHGLVMVAARFEPGQVPGLRTALRGLRARNQTHLHFTKERPDRRGKILAEVLRCTLVVDVYDAGVAGTDHRGRRWCLEQIVEDTLTDGPGRVVVEQDESVLRADQSVLYAATGRCLGKVTYAILPKRDEAALWAADALAWCWANPGWRPRVLPVIRHVRRMH
jgi:hypothetical protein